MRPYSSIRSAALLALAALLLTGCATTRIAYTWQDSTDSRVPAKRLVVFVAAKDEAVRRFAENQAVQSLAAGTVGVASYTLSEAADPDLPKLRARLAQEGFEAAVVARLVSVDRTKTYHPPRLEYMPGPWMWPTMSPFYWSYPYTYLTPAYVSETTRVIVETSFYRLPEGRLAWSGVSETTNPDSTLALVEELVRVLGGALRREGLIAAK